MMHTHNNAALVKRGLMVKLLKHQLNGALLTAVDHIPREVTADGYQPIRCCVHHDRVILKARLVAELGFDVESRDPDQPLRALAEAALARAEGLGDASTPLLTVVDDACHACVRSQFLVTNACQGCLARPCKMNCPKGAIKMVLGKAFVDSTRCVNCGICLDNCPYHAIVKIPVPCEEACPVGAISKGENGKERIDLSKCIHCGRCLKECPFGAVMECSRVVDVVAKMQAGASLVALYAPAIAAQFKATRGQLYAALKAAGFTAVMEVARGAERTACHEAEELLERLDAGAPFMTTSCCPAWTETVRLHLPALADKVSKTASPMAYASQLADAEHPGMIKVFIGPCLAKRQEARLQGTVDYVMSAEELGALFLAKGIEVGALPEPADLPPPAHPLGRGFPTSGGVAAAVKAHADERCVAELIAGLDKRTLRTLNAYGQGTAPQGTLLEVMACEGGCLGGPAVMTHPKVAAGLLRKALAER